MIVEVASKDELEVVAGKFKNVSAQFTSETVDIIGNLSKTDDFDGINISQASTVIQNNLKNISGEVETLASKIINYIADIKDLDTYDIRLDEEKPSNYKLTEEGNNSSTSKKTSNAKTPLFLFENIDSNSNDV